MIEQFLFGENDEDDDTINVHDASGRQQSQNKAYGVRTLHPA